MLCRIEISREQLMKPINSIGAIKLHIVSVIASFYIYRSLH